MRLYGKNAFVTGGNSGIGRATVNTFVQEGARVVAVGREESALQETVSPYAERAFAVRADVTDYQSLQRAAAFAAEQLGQLHIVFANAGVGGATPIGATEVSDFRRLIDVNLTGAFFTVQAVLPYLASDATIILTGSVQSTLGTPGYSGYSASKAGIRALTRVLAAELGPRGFRVNMVTPGATLTPIWKPLGMSDEEAARERSRVSESIPMGRFGTADEIAKVVAFLASNESTYIQGAEIIVDGGATGSSAGAPVYRRV